MVAQEASRRRVRTLQRLCARWGATAVSVVAADALRPPFSEPVRRRPRSTRRAAASGTLARHPDIRWRCQEKDLERHAARQRALLVSLAPLVRDGGRLVYATCSIEPEENEQVVVPFLEAHPDFSSEPLPAWASAFADGPFVRIEPAPGRGDAFFAAPLRRAIRGPLAQRIAGGRR